MKTITFAPLKTKRLSQLIEDSIKDMILIGELSPGSRLPNEQELSRQFGVSTVTIREALRGLEAFGVIQKKRGKGGGIFVAQAEKQVVGDVIQSFLSINKTSSADINEVRAMLEPKTAKLAAARITKSDLKQLENNIISCQKKINVNSQVLSQEEFLFIEERNVDFHRLIAEATHNIILALTISYIEDFLFSFKKANITADMQFSRENIDGHWKIYRALADHDEQQAEAMMIQHVTSVGTYLSTKDGKSSLIKQK